MHLLACAAFVLMSAAPADSVTDYIPDAWRECASLEMVRASSRDPDLRSAWIDGGIAQLTLGPFETLDFIRSDEPDPRGVARLRCAKFEVRRGEFCAGTMDVYETHQQFSDSLYLEAMFLRQLEPVPCGYNPIETARAMARTPQSICELILPLELVSWRRILIDTEDRGTLVMEIPSAWTGGGEVDSTAITVTSLADWSARAKSSLREWLRLDEPLPPVSHHVPDDVMKAAELWLHGQQGSTANALSQYQAQEAPVLGEPTVEFFITELELARYAESDEVDPTRFDVNPRYIVPVVVEGREILFATFMWTGEDLGRRVPPREGDYMLYGFQLTNDDGGSFVRPSGLTRYGHVAIMTTREMHSWYHVLGPDGALFVSTQNRDGDREPVPLDVFAGWAKLQIRTDFRNR